MTRKAQPIDHITEAIEAYWRLDAEGQRSKSPSLYWAAGETANEAKRLLAEYRHQSAQAKGKE